MASDNASAQELYFLYELARSFASSLNLAEVTENVLDGTCALLGTEQGFIYFLDGQGVLVVHANRGLTDSASRELAEAFQTVLSTRKCLAVPHPDSEQGAAMAAPLVAHDQVQGLVGVASTYARQFTPQETGRLSAVSNLASLALENARLHERVQRELTVLRQLIQAAKLVGSGQLSAAEAAEMEKLEGWDEIGELRQVFGQMAQQVIRREEDLRRQVELLQIEIDESKRRRQVEEIVDSEYFQELRKKAKEIRQQE